MVGGKGREVSGWNEEKVENAEAGSRAQLVSARLPFKSTEEHRESAAPSGACHLAYAPE